MEFFYYHFIQKKQYSFLSFWLSDIFRNKKKSKEFSPKQSKSLPKYFLFFLSRIVSYQNYFVRINGRSQSLSDTEKIGGNGEIFGEKTRKAENKKFVAKIIFAKTLNEDRSEKDQSMDKMI